MTTAKRHLLFVSETSAQVPECRTTEKKFFHRLRNRAHQLKLLWTHPLSMIQNSCIAFEEVRLSRKSWSKYAMCDWFKETQAKRKTSSGRGITNGDLVQNSIVLRNASDICETVSKVDPHITSDLPISTFGNNQDHDNCPALKRKLQENHIDSILPPPEKSINQESHIRDPKLNPGDVSQDLEGNSGGKLEKGESGVHMVSPEPGFSPGLMPEVHLVSGQPENRTAQEGDWHLNNDESPLSEERRCHGPDFEGRLDGFLRSLGQGQGLTQKQKNEPNFSAMTMLPDECLIFGVADDKSPKCQMPSTDNCDPYSSSSRPSEGKIKRWTTRISDLTIEIARSFFP